MQVIEAVKFVRYDMSLYKMISDKQGFSTETYHFNQS